MALWPTYGTDLPAAPLELRSRLLAHWRAHDLTLHAELTGLTGVLTRAATGTATDSNGTTYTAVNAQPRWDWRDLDGDSVREAVGLLMGTGDRLVWSDGGTALSLIPKAMAFSLEFVETGGVTTSSAANLYLGNNGVTGARFFLDATGTYYRLRHHNGTSEVTVTLAVAPTAGQLVRLRGQLYADGSVQLWQQINGGVETATARSGANTLAATWGAGSAFLRLNALGSGNASTACYLQLKLAAGLPDLATLLRLF
ncbi:hypothetical protein [Gemmatimonas sp.]